VAITNLAAVLRASGETAAARSLFEHALSMRKRVLKPDHPHTAANLYDLGLLLQAEGELAAARPNFERALAIRERVLGPDHPDTVATRRALEELAAEEDGATAST
jgi:tetratricopeptide (TPR) repeat protein